MKNTVKQERKKKKKKNKRKAKSKKMFALYHAKPDALVQNAIHFYFQCKHRLT